MSVFDQNTQPPNTPPENNDPFADKLKNITNEQGQPKYKDTNAALDALIASQQHIQRLEAEAAERKRVEDELKSKASQADVLQEVVNRLTKNNSVETPKVETPTNTGLTEDKIEQLVTQQLEKRRAQETAQKNVVEVTNSLTAKFGDEVKTKAAVAQKAAELGTTAEALGILSSSNPKLVLSLFGITAPTSTPAITTPSSSNSNSPPSNELKRPERSLLSGPGATDKNRREMMQKIKEDIYRKFEITT